MASLELMHLLLLAIKVISLLEKQFYKHSMNFHYE